MRGDELEYRSLWFGKTRAKAPGRQPTARPASQLDVHGARGRS